VISDCPFHPTRLPHVGTRLGSSESKMLAIEAGKEQPKAGAPVARQRHPRVDPIILR
jgi:hypothetical protein